MTLIIFYLFLIFNLFSKLLLTEICLPFTFYFTIFPLLLFTFSFRIFTFSFSLTYVFFLVFTRTSNPPPLPPLLVRLFSVRAVVPIILLFWGCVRFSGHVPRLCISFFSFFCGFLFLLVREKHRKTLYRLLLIK